jgi:hypothetical protein
MFLTNMQFLKQSKKGLSSFAKPLQLLMYLWIRDSLPLVQPCLGRKSINSG